MVTKSSKPTSRGRNRLPEPERQAIGRRIRVLREARGLSQVELAKRANLDPASQNQIEMGRRAPDLVTAQSIARALEVSVAAILEEDVRAANAERVTGKNESESSHLSSATIQLAVERSLANFVAQFVAVLGEWYSAHLRGEGGRPGTSPTGTGGLPRTRY